MLPSTVHKNVKILEIKKKVRELYENIHDKTPSLKSLKWIRNKKNTRNLNE